MIDWIAYFAHNYIIKTYGRCACQREVEVTTYTHVRSLSCENTIRACLFPAKSLSNSVKTVTSDGISMQNRLNVDSGSTKRPLLSLTNASIE